MAYINGEYTHEVTGVIIEVLEPEKEECNYNDGLSISIDADGFAGAGIEDLESLGNWILERAKFIKANFTKKGKLKKQKQ